MVPPKLKNEKKTQAWKNKPVTKKKKKEEHNHKGANLLARENMLSF